MDIENVLRWAPLAAEIAPLYGLSVTTVLAIVAVETGWTGDPKLINDEWPHAVGLMQIVPDTEITGRPSTEELKDPVTNIRWGCYELRRYWRSGGSLYAGLYRYSGGKYWEDKGGWPAFSKKYWTKFLRAKLEIVAALAEKGDTIIVDREFYHSDRRPNGHH